MKIKNHYCLLFYLHFLFLCLLQAVLFSENLEIKNDKSQYSIIFTQLEGKNLSQANQDLVYKIPLLIKEGIGKISEHVLNPEKIISLQENARKAQKYKKYKEIRDLKAERDKELYGEEVSPEDTKAEYQPKIEALLEELKKIDAVPLNEIQVTNPLPVVFLEDSSQGWLFSPPRFSPLAFSEEKKGDLLLTGSIEEIYGYLYLEIQIFDRILEKNVFNYSNSGQAKVIIEEVKEININPLILGKDYASLTISPHQEKAFVYVDDSFAGIGETRLPYIEPGDHKIRVFLKGHRDYNQDIFLKAGDKEEISVKLDVFDMPQVEITTEPPEALVYENSMYKGLTPLSLTKYDTSAQIIIKKEGFLDLNFQLNTNSPSVLNFTLRDDEKSLNDILKEKRNNFYFAFGWALVSVPLPFFLYTMATDYANHLDPNKLSSDEYTEYYNKAYTALYSTWGTAVVTAGLVTYAVWQLYLYLEAANDLTN